VAGALETLKSVKAPLARAEARVGIARAVAKAGDRAAALRSLDQARREALPAKGTQVKDADAQALYLIAEAQAALGDAAGALVWVEQLESPRVRAGALLAVARSLNPKQAGQEKQEE
jgi:hypothetical protein